MKLLGYKTPNEVWDEEMAKLQSKQADPKPAVALTSESGCRVCGGVCPTNIAPPRHGPAPPDIVPAPPDSGSSPHLIHRYITVVYERYEN